MRHDARSRINGKHMMLAFPVYRPGSMTYNPRSSSSCRLLIKGAGRMLIRGWWTHAFNRWPRAC